MGVCLWRCRMRNRPDWALRLPFCPGRRLERVAGRPRGSEQALASTAVHAGSQPASAALADRSEILTTEVGRQPRPQARTADEKVATSKRHDVSPKADKARW